MSSRDDRITGFGRSISEAFEPYLSLWVDLQDKQLSTMIPKYRQQPARPPDEDFSSQAVIPSSGELFQFYRLTLAQCAKLSSGSRLIDLSKTFARYLDEYAEQVLLNYLRDRPGGQGPPLEDTILVLNTADYCHVTCGQLEEKIKSRVDDELKSRVDLQSQADAFMGIASAAIRALVRKVEQDCDQSWREMRNYPWSKLETVGDQSSYVAELLRNVKTRAAEILPLLTKQQYARAFCDNLVELLAHSYLVNIVQCKPVSETGAEQMLLDSYVLKKGFEELMTLDAEPGVAAPAGYLKRVNQSMTKLDPLLKTLQVRSVPAEGLVQAYLIHIGDRSDTNFKKILDLKGVRKQDQAYLVELFQAHRASQDNLAQQSPLLTPLNIQSTNIGASIGSIGQPGSLSTASLQGRFDASTFGSAIMSAARDGVDKLGTPALVATATPSGAMSPAPVLPQSATNPTPGTTSNSADIQPHQTGNLNDNLRNIGKFFRRDMSGFGGRFGGGANRDGGG